jgi:hypothetical protein
MRWCFLASAAKGAPANPAATRTAIANLIFIMTDPFLRLSGGRPRGLPSHFNQRSAISLQSNVSAAKTPKELRLMMLGSLLALADTLVDHARPCYRTIPTSPPLRLSERRLPLFGTNRHLGGGQSTSARVFQTSTCSLLPARHPLRCQDIGPCVRSWYDRAATGRPASCPSADRSRLLLFVATNGSLK